MSALAGDLVAAYFTGFILFGLDACLQQELSRGWGVGGGTGGGTVRADCRIQLQWRSNLCCCFSSHLSETGSSTSFPAKGCRGDRPFTSVPPLL